MASNTRKISISLPSDVVDNLDYVSKNMGVTRSALLTGLLNEASSAMANAIRAGDAALGTDGKAEKVKRAVSSNLDALNSRIEDLREYVGTSH